MGTGIQFNIGQLSKPNSEESLFMQDYEKKEIRNKVRVTRNIMPKLITAENLLKRRKL